MAVLLQYNLWLNCNQHCSFCYQGSNPRRFNDAEKKASLERFIKLLNDQEIMAMYDYIAIIGGEIFDNPLTEENHKLFFEALSIIKNKLVDGSFLQFSLNTNLMYKDLTLLKETLDFFKENPKRITVVTSYDTKYRFHTEESRLLFLDNLDYINRHYPTCNKIVQSIVSSYFIEDVLSNKFNINDFEKKYNCEYNLNNVIHSDLVDRLGKNFFPTRKRYIDFLMFLKKTNLHLLQRFNVDKDDKDLIYCDPETNKIRVNTSLELKKLPCGHYETYQMYSDSDKCTLCDTRMIQGKLQ